MFFKKIILAIYLFLPLVSYSDIITLYFENDLLNNTDAYYTHATRITYTDNNWDYTIAQHIYTPENKKATEPLYHDRPYAGWLYGAAGTAHYFTNGLINYYEISLGLVGPYSYAEDTQKLVHKLTGSSDVNGWDNQIGTEPTLNIYDKLSYYSYQTKLFDFKPYIVGTVGNVMDSIGTGFDCRFGYNLPDRFDPNIHICNVSPEFIAFIYGGAEINFVIHNIFLDGSWFHDEVVTVPKQNYVHLFKGGIQVGYKVVFLQLTHIIKSREFDYQSRYELYDSISLTIAW